MERINQALRHVPSWLLYVVCVGHIGWLFYLGLSGALGVEPIKELEHAYGEAGLKALVLTLAVTPLRRYAGLNLMKFRRALGLVSFFYVAAHLLVWLVLDVQIISQIWADVLKRPYVTVGMGAFVLMIPLALTSNNASVRKLGGMKWRKLHYLTYPAAILGAVHFIMLVKGLQVEPIIYLTVILGLISTRFLRRR